MVEQLYWSRGLAFNSFKVEHHVHDTIKIMLRNTARDTLTTELKRLVPYLELVAEGDVNILMTTGYDMRQDLAHIPSNVILSAPDDFRVIQGTKSGSLDVHVAKLSGAGSL